jgi:hypothetical protein
MFDAPRPLLPDHYAVISAQLSRKKLGPEENARLDEILKDSPGLTVPKRRTALRALMEAAQIFKNANGGRSPELFDPKFWRIAFERFYSADPRSLMDPRWDRFLYEKEGCHKAIKVALWLHERKLI